MKTKLFLQGAIGAGKSTLIRKALLPFLPRAGGFFVQRILIEKQTAAFRLLPVDEADRYHLAYPVATTEGMDKLFLYCDNGDRWQQDLTVFERYGTAYLKQSLDRNKQLILMDELGGVELGCSAFMEMVMTLLDGDIPVIGVLKLPRNLAILRQCLQEKDKIEAYQSFYKRICSCPRTDLLDLTPPCHAMIAARVNSFIEAACR